MNLPALPAIYTKPFLQSCLVVELVPDSGLIFPYNYLLKGGQVLQVRDGFSCGKPPVKHGALRPQSIA